MKPHIKTAGITAAKLAAGLSAAAILGPLFMGLAVSVDLSPETISQKLLVAVFAFPIIFVVIWTYGIFTRKDITAGMTPIPASTNDLPKTRNSDKKAGLWNYIWIGVGAFMLLFVFLPQAIRGTLASQYYVGAAFWIGVIIYCSINISRSE